MHFQNIVILVQYFAGQLWIRNFLKLTSLAPGDHSSNEELSIVTRSGVFLTDDFTDLTLV